MKSSFVTGLFSFLMIGLACAQKPAQSTRQLGIDVLHYEFTLEIPDSGRTIQGKAALTVGRYENTDHLRLNLVSLDVHIVNIDGKTSNFTRDATGIEVPLPVL